MTIVICVDARNGMLFHNRRQSQDRQQRADLLGICQGQSLWMDEYSATLFSERVDEIHVAPDYLNKVKPGDYCFVERTALPVLDERINGVILYRWDRVYPADIRLDWDLEAAGFQLEAKKEFQGFSHEKIIKEIYRRREEHG